MTKVTPPQELPQVDARGLLALCRAYIAARVDYYNGLPMPEVTWLNTIGALLDIAEGWLTAEHPAMIDDDASLESIGAYEALYAGATRILQVAAEQLRVTL